MMFTFQVHDTTWHHVQKWECQWGHVSILQQFFSYLPKTGDGGVDGQLFSGDQLTVERAVNVISSVANGLTPQDRLEGINLQLGDWHAASQKVLSVTTTNINS